jgi:hypothetical protein
MAKRLSLKAAYAAFGIQVRNPRRPSWVEQATDGSVVVTLWSDCFLDPERRVYDVLSHSVDKSALGRQDQRRLDLLKRVEDMGGLFHSIIITPREPGDHSAIKKVEPGFLMRLVKLNDLGRFKAERAD